MKNSKQIHTIVIKAVTRRILRA